ncbi:thiamine pyrophosphokinase [Aphelenchoides avenae]|nr:thiamine pyrophosphokinase [Aphelenchus avenae]
MGKWLDLWNQAKVRYCTDGAANVLAMLSNENKLSPPNVICGDFESVFPSTKAFFDKHSFLKEIKDDDATALANTLRLLRESKELKEGQVTAVVVFGGISGRFDHTLAAIKSLLEHRSESSLPIVLLDGENLVTVLTEVLNVIVAFV